MNFRDIIDMDIYEDIVAQFISELESVGLKKVGYSVIKLPTQSFQGFFSSIPLLEALTKYGLRANLKTTKPYGFHGESVFRNRWFSWF